MKEAATCITIGFLAGFGVCVMLLILLAKPANQEALDNCAKTHNVYHCEMVAVPKTGEIK